MRFSYLLALILQYADCDRQTEFTMSINGSGLHRLFNLEISNYKSNSYALLKWDITPDFYVDVYELDRWTHSCRYIRFINII